MADETPTTVAGFIDSAGLHAGIRLADAHIATQAREIERLRGLFRKQSDDEEKESWARALWDAAASIQTFAEKRYPNITERKLAESGAIGYLQGMASAHHPEYAQRLADLHDEESDHA